MPAPFSLAPLRPESGAVGTGSILADTVGAGPNPYPASLETYRPTARETIRNYLSDMLGGGRENSFKAENLVRMIDLTPAGSLLTANDAGRSFAGGLMQAAPAQAGYGAGLMNMAYSPQARESLLRAMAVASPGLGHFTHGLVPKMALGMADNIADWGIRAGLEPFEFGKEAEARQRPMLASSLPFSLAPTR